MPITAGVVAVQGDVEEHARALETATSEQIERVAIRSKRDVRDCDVIAVPGGESTTISRHLTRTGIGDALVEHVERDKPLLATCAGLIVASRDANDDRIETLGLIDATVERNAFGRQRDSFETALDVEGLEEPYPAAFIRAPAIETVGGATVIARHEGRPVAVEDGPVIGTAFHPELTGDSRLHERLLENCRP